LSRLAYKALINAKILSEENLTGLKALDMSKLIGKSPTFLAKLKGFHGVRDTLL